MKDVSSEKGPDSLKFVRFINLIYFLQLISEIETRSKDRKTFIKALLQEFSDLLDNGSSDVRNEEIYKNIQVKQ